ncbi:shikimate kinase [Candidatus Omnitrophota bacterium]
MRNIVLVGFMGTGKTAVARELSKKLGMKYVSTDDMIEAKEKTSISDIFSKKGEKHFRTVEKEVIKEVSSMEGVVVDAGGGVVVDPENLANLKKTSSIICLWAEPGEILERTRRTSHRPLLKVQEPLAKIKDLLNKRKPFYERADHHICTSKMSVENVAKEAERIARDDEQ